MNKPTTIKLNKIMFGNSILAITLYPFVFVRKDSCNDVLINHEAIHLKQQLELLIIPFYILYLLFYIFGFLKSNDPYWSIPFEKEAYQNQNNLNYLNSRKHYAFLKYL